jgi:phosphoglycerate dehydrogenase-like enzyme
MGAGVDSLLRDATLPRHVPLLRVIDPLMSERMATWVLWGVINCQRRCDAYARAQRERRWDKAIENFRSVDNAELRVGVMGLGALRARPPTQTRLRARSPVAAAGGAYPATLGGLPPAPCSP